MENKKHKIETRNTKSLLPPLETFRSKLSNSLNNLNKESEMFSLEFVKQCFQLFPLINKEFAKLVLELDCPTNKWDISNTDEYLNYTLNILKLLNSVSSCLSNLSQDSVSLFHALQLAENSPSLAAKHLSNINPKEFGNRFKFEVPKINEERKKSSGKGSKKGHACKESVIHEALVVMKNISFWVFGVLLSGLCSDVKPYVEMRKLVGRFDEPLFRILDTKVEREILGKKGEVKEVKDVIIAGESLFGALGTRNTKIAPSELRSRLEIVEKLLEGLQKETSDMFGEILDARNNLLDSLRQAST